MQVVNCLAKFLRVDRESQKTSFASTKNSNHASTCIFGFQLLANQLSQFECCEELLLAVLQLASGRQILRLEQMDNFQQLPLGPSFAVWPEASVVLLACINRCTSADLAAKYVSTLAQVGYSISTLTVYMKCKLVWSCRHVRGPYPPRQRTVWMNPFFQHF